MMKEAGRGIASKTIVAGPDGAQAETIHSIATSSDGEYTPAMTERTMNEVHGQTCAVAASTEQIETKWPALIVPDLSEGPRRFMALEHACPGISPRTLSERLQMLEQEGVVIR